MKQCLRTLHFIFSFFGLLFSEGCSHYSFGYGSPLEKYQSISVSYIEGDKDGDLTTELIKRISTTGVLRYQTCGGDLILQGKLLSLTDENIGFRYDRKKDGHLKKDIIPSETRLKSIVEISLIEASTGLIVKGPICITSSLSFDHEDYYIRHAVNRFSLCQLSDFDTAHEAALHPLNKRLAEKIVDSLINCW